MEPDPILLRLRLAGFGATDRLATALGQPADVVGAALDGLAARGWARFRDGRAAGVASGWSLTPAGRAEADRQLAAEIDDNGCRPAVEDAYRSFVALNRPLLETITDWQVRNGVVNDHADHRHDARVLTRLDQINEKISPVLVDLAACVERYGSYGDRLDAAIDRARSGETAYVDRPLVDSYHTVWFELHEDLLATLGLDRTQEREREPEPEQGPNLTSEVP